MLRTERGGIYLPRNIYIVFSCGRCELLVLAGRVLCWDSQNNFSRGCDAGDFIWSRNSRTFGCTIGIILCKLFFTKFVFDPKFEDDCPKNLYDRSSGWISIVCDSSIFVSMMNLIIYSLNTIVLASAMLFILMICVAYLNFALLPTQYDVALNNTLSAEVITRSILYGLALVEWTTFIGLLSLLNRTILGKNTFDTIRRFLVITWIIGGGLLILAIISR